MATSVKYDNDLMNTIMEIHFSVGVIEEKCSNMEEHLKVQNGRLNKHAESISKISGAQKVIQTKMWILFVLIGGVGGLVGGIIVNYIGAVIM